MDINLRMQNAVDYIENHLSDNLSLQDVAAQAYYSYPHFQELFRHFSGFNLADYIRRRRFARASLDLLCTDLRIYDIALKYGFECHESFTRAFTREFSMTPQIFRLTVQELEVQRKLDFQDTCRFTIACFKPKLVVRRQTPFFGIQRLMKINSGTENREEADFVFKILTDPESSLVKAAGQQEIRREFLIGTCSAIDSQSGTYRFQTGFILDNWKEKDLKTGLAPASLFLKYETELTDDEHFLFSDYLHDRLVPHRDSSKLIFNIHHHDALFQRRKTISNYFPVILPI